MPYYIALRCQVISQIDYLININIYKKLNYFIHATFVYVYSPTSPISHLYKRVIVIV